MPKLTRPQASAARVSAIVVPSKPCVVMLRSLTFESGGRPLRLAPRAEAGEGGPRFVESAPVTKKARGFGNQGT